MFFKVNLMFSAPCGAFTKGDVVTSECGKAKEGLICFSISARTRPASTLVGTCCAKAVELLKTKSVTPIRDKRESEDILYVIIDITCAQNMTNGGIINLRSP
jgi:hypothetical protein